MPEHYIAELEDVGDGVIRVEHYPTKAEAVAARNPTDPPTRGPVWVPKFGGGEVGIRIAAILAVGHRDGRCR